MSIPSTVIPAYPYEGGIYWLLGEGSVRHDTAAEVPGYYRNFYGDNPGIVSQQASALIALFDKVELLSADHALPDYSKYSNGANYWNPELRIAQSAEIGEFAPDALALTDYLLRSKPALSAYLNGAKIHDPFAQTQFVSRVILQARRAVRSDAVLIGNDLFECVYNIVLPSMGAFIEGWPLESPPPQTLNVKSHLLNVTCLNLPSPTFDVFCKIRESSEISEYAKGFREALGVASLQGDLEKNFLGLMREARDKKKIAAHLKGAMQTTGSLSSVAGTALGVLPFGGTITTLTGLTADLAGRRVEKSAKQHDWFMFGTKLQSVGLEAVLDQR